jgi:hypothetical protein
LGIFDKLNLSAGLDKLKGWGVGALAFSDKNAPALMTGGGLVLGWFAAYMFWKKSKDAEKCIGIKEAELQSEVAPGKDILGTMENRVTLPTKERFAIYLQYCWWTWLLGLGATGLIIGGQKVSMNRLAEMFVLTKVLEDKNGRQSKTIEKLKEAAGLKDGSEAMRKFQDKYVEEEYPEEKALAIANSIDTPGEGNTFIIDETTGHSWRDNAGEFAERVNAFGLRLFNERNEMLDRRAKSTGAYDPFFASDNPHSDYLLQMDDLNNVYSSATLREFLAEIKDPCIGEDNFGVGDVMEIRFYNRDKKPLTLKSFVRSFKRYGKTEFIFLNYDELLMASGELMDRSPL